MASIVSMKGVVKAYVRGKQREFADGVETIRAGLSLALEHELTAEAAELYQRLGTALETSADYGGAREALGTAVGLCEASGAAGQAVGAGAAEQGVVATGPVEGVVALEAVGGVMAVAARPEVVTRGSEVGHRSAFPG